MADTYIKYNDHSISSAFKDHYIVPDYQREYVWKDEQIEQLTSDLIEAYNADNKKAYFLGTIVTYDAGSQFELIDGQQRLTTFFSGQRIMAEFEFDFKAMNIIYDKYGEDTKITKLGEDKYYAKLPVEDSPTFWGWIFMLEDRIRILSPTYLVNEYAEKLKHINTIVNYS